MRFDSFLQSLDMGVCQDQSQREALLDLALLFVAIDGHVDENETAFLLEWLKSIPWSDSVSQDAYYESAMDKCLQAVVANHVEDFINHRASLLIDAQIKSQALKLARDISHADGVLDPKEAEAIAMLETALA